MARIALLALLAGCGARDEWTPRYAPLPGEGRRYAFADLRGGGRVVFESWSSDTRARAVDGVGWWYDAGGRVRASGRLHLPLRSVWRIRTVRIRPRRYDPTERALLAAGAIALITVELVACVRDERFCD